MKRGGIVLSLLALAGCKDKPAQHVPEVVAPYRAALDAPAGATPCESSFNAFLALGEAAKKAQMDPPWKSFPAKDAYLAACAAVPVEAQECMIPKNQGNRAKCDPILEKMQATEAGKKLMGLLEPRK